MYNIIKSVITNKDYDLSQMLHTIDVMFIQGKITEEEQSELITLARGEATQAGSVEILNKLNELDKRIRALEAKEETDSTVVEYTEFQPSKWYYAGDKITFENKKYVCSAPEGIVCVWNPTDKPDYWNEIVE